MQQRERFENAIAEGGTVLWKGEILQTLDALPSQEEIDDHYASMDPARAETVSAARAANAAAAGAPVGSVEAKRIAELEAEIARLRATAGVASAPGTTGAAPSVPPADTEPNTVNEAELRAELDTHTVDSLVSGAKDRGIDLGGATKKADIIDAIVAGSATGAGPGK